MERTLCVYIYIYMIGEIVPQAWLGLAWLEAWTVLCIMQLTSRVLFFKMIRCLLMEEGT